MKRKAVSGIMLTLLLAGMLTLAFNIHPTKAEPITWIVDDDGPSDFSSIQEAINAADEGDTIYVKIGTYYETIVVNKTVSLIGENRNDTIIDGEKAHTVVRIIGNNVVLTGFTIQWGMLFGIHLRNSTGDIVTDNTILNTDPEAWTIFSSGIRLDDSHFNNISKNYLSTNRRGIYLGNSNNNIVHGNYIEKSVGQGIYWFHGQGNIINENTVIKNLYGIAVADANEGVIARNIVINSYYSGVSLRVNSVNNLVTDNTILKNDQGIHLSYSANNIIYHNSFINNTKQASLFQSYNNIWDDGYPYGGNYWSDYAGVDEKSGRKQRKPGSDDLGDTPYIIDENNQDDYPLMEPWSPKSDPMKALEELIQTVESWNLDTGIERSLISKLQAAHRSLERENQKAAIGHFAAFTNHVRALEDKKLTFEQASQLIAEAQRIIDLIEG